MGRVGISDVAGALLLLLVVTVPAVALINLPLGRLRNLNIDPGVRQFFIPATEVRENEPVKIWIRNTARQIQLDQVIIRDFSSGDLASFTASELLCEPLDCTAGSGGGLMVTVQPPEGFLTQGKTYQIIVIDRSGAPTTTLVRAH